MMRVTKYVIHIGLSISVDEMDISLKGRHKYKQRVNYKKGGDGFLVDALCTEGYTYSWYFKNQLAPRKWIGYGPSPLHGRVMSLFEKIPGKTGNYICIMDNLFNSPKFSKQALDESGKDAMTHGVCRQGRGTPKCIVQYAVTKKMSY